MRIALPVRVELAGRPVMKDAGRLDRSTQGLQPAVPLDLRMHRLAGELDGPAGHHRLPGGRAGAGGSDRRVGRAEDDAVDAELRADDLRHDRIQPLADLDRGRLHVGDWALPVDRDADPCLRGIVEALAITEVL